MGELGPEVGWMSRNQKVGGQAVTSGQVGELGPEVRWVSWDQRLGG